MFYTKSLCTLGCWSVNSEEPVCGRDGGCSRMPRSSLLSVLSLMMRTDQWIVRGREGCSSQDEAVESWHGTFCPRTGNPGSHALQLTELQAGDRLVCAPVWKKMLKRAAGSQMASHNWGINVSVLNHWFSVVRTYPSMTQSLMIYSKHKYTILKFTNSEI